MPLLLACLSFAYLGYALFLTVPSHTGIIIISLLFGSYVILFTIVIPKPEYSLYAFLLLSLFIPASGENFLIIKIEETFELKMNYIVQSIASITVCLAIITNRTKSTLLKTGKLNAFFVLIICSIIFLIFLNSIYFSQDRPYGISFNPQDFISYGPLLFSTVFLLGCLNFINDLKKLETMYGIFLLFGIVMSLECIAYFLLRLPLPYADRVINWSGRFCDFFLADSVKVGMLAGPAIGSALYFIFSRRAYYCLPFIPALFLPIIFTYQRAPMAMGVLIVGIFLLLTLTRHSVKVLALPAMVLAVTGVLLWGEIGVVEPIARTLEGDVRPDYFISYMDSWESRLGAHLRALEVMVYEPLGVGYYKAGSFMSSTAIPSNFQISADWAKAREFYKKISSGEHETTSHNFFLDFGIEYGLFGFVALLWLLYGCIANFRRFTPAVKRGHIKDHNLVLLHYANFGILSGIALYGLYQNSRLYAVVFFFAFVTFLAGKLQPLAELPAGRRVMIQNRQSSGKA